MAAHARVPWNVGTEVIPIAHAEPGPAVRAGPGNLAPRLRVAATRCRRPAAPRLPWVAPTALPTGSSATTQPATTASAPNAPGRSRHATSRTPSFGAAWRHPGAPARPYIRTSGQPVLCQPARNAATGATSSRLAPPRACGSEPTKTAPFATLPTRPSLPPRAIGQSPRSRLAISSTASTVAR